MWARQTVCVYRCRLKAGQTVYRCRLVSIDSIVVDCGTYCIVEEVGAVGVTDYIGADCRRDKLFRCRLLAEQIVYEAQTVGGADCICADVCMPAVVRRGGGTGMT